MTVFGQVHVPSLGGATAWLGSEPLGPAELRGHVVLVDRPSALTPTEPTTSPGHDAPPGLSDESTLARGALMGGGPALGQARHLEGREPRVSRTETATLSTGTAATSAAAPRPIYAYDASFEGV